MTYFEFLDVLKAYQEESFAEFQRKLVITKQKILGIRTPIMRKLAKEYKNHFEEIFAFPDAYFEVTFIKLAMLSALPYEKFIEKLPKAVAMIDNWATCDCFKAKCISNHKEEFLPVLKEIFQKKGEFDERYVLVVLLTNYVEEKYFPVLEKYLRQANTNMYYVHMAAAWLTAEILIKYYENGIRILKKGILGKNTHNKAIQKAIESYRLNNEQKEYLRSLKIK